MLPGGQCRLDRFGFGCYKVPKGVFQNKKKGPKCSIAQLAALAANMGWSRHGLKPCKQDLGEAPSEARVPRPGGSMQVLQQAHVRCTRRGSFASLAASPWCRPTRECCTYAFAGTCKCRHHAHAATMQVLHPCTCCTYASAATCKCRKHAHGAPMQVPHPQSCKLI